MAEEAYNSDYPVEHAQFFFGIGGELMSAGILLRSETGEVVTGTGNPYGSRVQSLVVVNAVDGTIY